MTYEEVQKLAAAQKAEESKIRGLRKKIEDSSGLSASFERAQTRETRSYELGPGVGWAANMRFNVTFNPLHCSVFSHEWQHGPSNWASSAWVAFGELMLTIDNWKAGLVQHMPPSGTWEEARAWLASLEGGAAPKDGVFR